MSKKFISNEIELKQIKKDHFNIIASGCGTGKTYFCCNNLLDYFDDISPDEVLFITSRAMIVEQQIQSEKIIKYDKRDIDSVKYWNMETDDLNELKRKGIQIMTYDKVIHIIDVLNTVGKETLSRIKLVICDECHTLFSDTFIQGVDALRVWIRDQLYWEKKIFLGLTATPGIILYYQKPWGVKVNQVNENILSNYKANQLICTNFESIPYLVTSRLKGKSLIMCYSIQDCNRLQKKIPNSAILVSKSSKQFTEEMSDIRDYIIQNNTFPEEFITSEGEKRKLDVLITTSTLREGVNLDECSGVKNVVCCITDELHVSQFVGRCRFDIENLVVAETFIRSDNMKPSAYLTVGREWFKQYYDNFENDAWFKSISHLVRHGAADTKKIIYGSDPQRFIDYINNNWLVPPGTSSTELRKYRIFKDEDRQFVANLSQECNLFDMHPARITFNRIMRLMVESLGYTIKTGKLRVGDKLVAYKEITSFDKNKITYEPPFYSVGLNEE